MESEDVWKAWAVQDPARLVAALVSMSRERNTLRESLDRIAAKGCTATMKNYTDTYRADGSCGYCAGCDARLAVAVVEES